MAIRRFTISALCSLALLSCNGNLERSEMEKESLIPVTLTVGGAKSSMEANGCVSFAPGDRIAVYDGTAVREFVTAAGGSTATFKGEVSESTTRVWVASPYDPDMTVTDGKIITYVPRVQYADQAGSFGKTANVSIGTAVLSEGTFNLELKNVSSLIPIDVPAGVDSVLVSGLANEIVSGQFSADFGDPNGEISNFTNVYKPFTGEKHIENEIVLKAPGSGNITPGIYYLCAKPGTLSGYRCLYYKTDGGVLKGSLKTSEPDVTLVRNGISTQGISFDPAEDWHEVKTIHIRFRKLQYLYDDAANQSASNWPFTNETPKGGSDNHQIINCETTVFTTGSGGYQFYFGSTDSGILRGTPIFDYYLNSTHGMQTASDFGNIKRNWKQNFYLQFVKPGDFNFRLISVAIAIMDYRDDKNYAFTIEDSTTGTEVGGSGASTVRTERGVPVRLCRLNLTDTCKDSDYRIHFNYNGTTLSFGQWKYTWLATD